MAKSLEILPPSPGSGFSRCKWAKTAQLWKFQKNHRQMSLFSVLSPNTCTEFPLTACSLKPQMYWEDWEVWRYPMRPVGARYPTGHMDTPPRHPGPIPRLPGTLPACLWESTSSWVDSQVQWVVPSHAAPATGVQTLPETCHLWHSTLLPRTQQSPSLYLEWSRTLWLFIHSSFRVLFVSLADKRLCSFNECREHRMRNVASIKDTEWPFSTCQIASIAIETEHCS